MQRLDPSPEGLAEYRALPGPAHLPLRRELRVARWAWERVPYREVPYAEDQLLGRELIEAGFAKVFHPDARVLHSHDYPPVAFFRRYFDEFRSLREVLGLRQPWGPRQTPRDVRGLMGADKRWLEEQGVQRPRPRPAAARVGPPPCRRVWRARSSARAPTGCRAPLRRLLSLEGRDSFAPHEVPGALLERGDGELSTRTGRGSSCGAATRADRGARAARRRRRAAR